MSQLYSLILLFVLGITWGSGYAIAKYATMSGITPLAYSFWQSLGPAIVVSSIVLLCRQNWCSIVVHWRYCLICGLLGIAIPNTNMYFAAPHLPAGLLAVIVNTAPILTYPIALLCRQEKFNIGRLAGVVCGITGILCIVIPKAALPENYMLPIAIQALLTPLCFALCAVFIARFYPAKAHPMSLAAGMLIFSVLFLLPLIAFKHQFYPLFPPKGLPDYMVMVEIALSSLGYVIMFMLLKKAGPVYYSLVGGVVVLTGLFWGGQIFHEQLSFWLVMAVGLIFLGIMMVTMVSERDAV